MFSFGSRNDSKQYHSTQLKPREQVFFQFEIIMNVLVIFFRCIRIGPTYVIGLRLY